MSLLYKMFGMVRSFEDLADKLGKSGDQEVDLQVAPVWDNGYCLGYDVHLETPSEKKRLGTFYGEVTNFGAPGIGAAHAEAKALHYVARARDVLRTNGLDPKINGNLSDEYLESRTRELEETSNRFQDLTSLLNIDS